MKYLRQSLICNSLGLMFAMALILLSFNLSWYQHSVSQHREMILNALSWFDGQIDPLAETVIDPIEVERWGVSMNIAQLEVSQGDHIVYLFQRSGSALQSDSFQIVQYEPKPQSGYKLRVWIALPLSYPVYSRQGIFLVVAGGGILIFCLLLGGRGLITRLRGLRRLEARSEGILLGNELSSFKLQEWPLNAGKALDLLLDKLQNAHRDRVRFDHLIRQHAFVDELTGLPNQTQFLNALESAVADVNTVGGAMILLHIRGLDEINRRHGRSEGDHLIEQCGQLISKELKYFSNTILARFRGDQFAMMLPGVAVEKAEISAISILKLLRSLPLAEGQNHDDFFYMGVSCYRMGDQSGEVITLAEDALRTAQSQGNNSWFVIERSKPVISVNRGRVDWLVFFENALEARRVAFFEQLIVNVDGQPIGLELLARICDNNQWLTTATFMPWVVQCGLTHKFDGLAITRAMERISDAPAPVSINLNVETLLSPEILSQLVLWAVGVGHEHAGRLIIEVVESQLSHLSVTQIRRISMLRDKGIQLAVDRAGQVVESTESIVRLNPHYIKLHPSLVRDVHQRQVNRLAISSLLASANHDVIFIAVGVESAQEWHALRRLGVTGGQGHYFHQAEAIYGSGSK